MAQVPRDSEPSAPSRSSSISDAAPASAAPSGLAKIVAGHAKDAKASLLNAQIPLYGTIAGEDPPPGDKFAWFQRGYVLSLLQELSGFYGPYLMLCFTMVAAPFTAHVHIDDYFPCGMRKKYVQSLMGSVVCEYTKTYAWSFPQLAVVSILLLIGRDFLQKRFYYFLLKNGGVLSFMKEPILRDSIVVINIFAFAHFVLFCGLVALRLYLAGIDPKVAVTKLGEATMAAASNPMGAARSRPHASAFNDPDDPEGLQLLIHLAVFLGLPGALFISKLFASYDIQNTLIPLSEYVHDMTTGTVEEAFGPRPTQRLGDIDSDEECMEAAKTSKRLGSKAEELADLIHLKDNCVRLMLQSKEHLPDFCRAKAGDDQGNRYEELIRAYLQHGLYKLQKEPPRVQLLHSLWPAPFILLQRRKIQLDMARVGEHAGELSFQWVWRLFRQVALWICGFFLFVQTLALCLELRRCHTQHWQAIFSCIGELINIYFMSYVWSKFYAALPPDISQEDSSFDGEANTRA